MTSRLIIAFGSQVTGRATKMSDHDFAVLADKPLSLAERTDMAYHISKKLNINEDQIDLIDLSAASPILKMEIARNSKLIEGEPFYFIRFKVRAMKEYEDTSKFRRLREKVMMKSYVE